ncbi:MAG: hypothetical protein M1834_003554 [Cirrosporium novae-zelandiae]|nr:MAG: hypothetical protein M1834_003554 [Cirrosporium novae-zelandiae]
MQVEKENLTITGPIKPHKRHAEKSKKLRSKSIGPGGLDALKEEAGNRRKSAILPIMTPRSILKRYHPLSPPKGLFGTGRSGSPSKQQGRNSLFGDKNRTITGNLSNPFGDLLNKHDTTIAVKSEEQQMAEAREREEKDKRDERRKSLASRRVSFAPEATLHMWHDEIAEESTTSSASTNSTRRASSLSAASSEQSPHHAPQPPSQGSDASEPPSTPPEHIEGSHSPEDQRQVHQKKRRRSSAIPPMNFNDPFAEASDSSSPGEFIVGSDDVVPAAVTIDEDVSSSSDSGIDEEGGSTMMSIDNGDDTTRRSIASNHSSTSSSGTLDARLREAARMAGTRGIDYDEHGDMTMEAEMEMEMADDEVTAAFQPWSRQDEYVSEPVQDLAAVQDKENANPFSSVVKADTGKSLHEVDGDGDMTGEMDMDMTTAVGGILPPNNQDTSSSRTQRRKSVKGNRRRSSVARRRSSGERSSLGEEPMDITMAIGGIQEIHEQNEEQDKSDDIDENEELSMEFTAAVGGILGRAQAEDEHQGDVKYPQLPPNPPLPDTTSPTIDDYDDDDDMEMTTAVGGILPTIEEQTEPSETSRRMDFTEAIGAILPKEFTPGNQVQAKELMQMETDAGQIASSPFQIEAKSPPKSWTPKHLAAVALENSSPSLMATRTRSGSKRASGARRSTTPKSPVQNATPQKKPLTPPKQLTPQPGRPTTPGKTPPSKNVTMRGSSPKKLFKQAIKNSTPKPASAKKLFNEDPITGISTPSIILKPHERRISGQGIDKEGLGSPRVAALLDRRASIGESAEVFTPQEANARGVRFADPREMAEEVDQEREEEQRRESGRFILEQEADLHDDEQDITATLKHAIESLSPKKRKVNGRKSLAVGTARGLLGKRPAELDEDEESDNGTPKRLKGREGSPVRQIHLPPPPPKDEITGRLTRSVRKSLGISAGNGQHSTPSTSSPSKAEKNNTTPKGQGRFKDAEVGSASKPPPTSFTEKVGTNAERGEEPEPEPEEEEEPIHLRDFLQMTSIRFMELDTTKRRHTIAPNGLQDQGGDTATDGAEKPSLEDCVVAGACTIPMLELYQHSCRELKKYISEGRRVAQQIEQDTYAENPPLFREYISAPPDLKIFMDNQFKNVKTYARLNSKATWYDWRMKLVEGVKNGLEPHLQGMNKDEEVLGKIQAILDKTLPELVEKHDQLKKECKRLEENAEALENCDQDKLQDARERLLAVDEQLEAKQEVVSELQAQLQEKEEALEQATQKKQAWLEEIQEAEKIKEEFKGYSVGEVAALKSRVDALEKKHGWAISAASPTSLTMTYRKQLQLVFSPNSFLPNNPAITILQNPNPTPISLTYIDSSSDPLSLPTEKRFFLQAIQATLHALPQSQTRIAHLLHCISQPWDRALSTSSQISSLHLTNPVSVNIVSDNLLAVKTSMLIKPLRTKVSVTFYVQYYSSYDGDGDSDEDMGIKNKNKTPPSEVKIIYGEQFKLASMEKFLETMAAERGRGWGDVVRELEGRLRESR